MSVVGIYQSKFSQDLKDQKQKTFFSWFYFALDFLCYHTKNISFCVCSTNPDFSFNSSRIFPAWFSDNSFHLHSTNKASFCSSKLSLSQSPFFLERQILDSRPLYAPTNCLFFWFKWKAKISQKLLAEFFKRPA